MSQAKVVQYRRGTTYQNDNFTGDEGEIVVDTENITAIVHDGKTQGGWRLARADCSNINTNVLAQEGGHSGPALARADMGNVDTATLATGRGNKNLAYVDLRNYETNTSVGSRIEIGEKLRNDYSLAKTDFSNCREELIRALEDSGVAHQDSHDIYTRLLAEGTSGEGNRDPSIYGKNLAYADMSNVNCESLGGNDAHLIGGKKLAYTDFSNVNIASVLADKHVEFTTNKKNTIDATLPSNDYYPTTSAVISYVEDVISGEVGVFANRSLTNITDWTAASLPVGGSQLYEYDFDVVSVGTGGYNIGDSFPLNSSVSLIVTEVDESHKIAGAELSTEVGTDSTGSGVVTLGTGGASINFKIFGYEYSVSIETNASGHTVGEVVELNGSTKFVVDSILDGGLIDRFHLSEEKGLSNEEGMYYTPQGATLHLSATSLYQDINGGGLMTNDMRSADIVACKTTLEQTLGMASKSYVDKHLNALRSATPVVLTSTTTLTLTPGTQVIELNNSSDLTAANIVLTFTEPVTPATVDCYTFEVHVACNEVCPTLTWSVSSGETIRWLTSAITSPTDANKTTFYTFRQQRGKIIANNAGVY